MDFKKCTTTNKNKIITAEENKRKLVLKNPNGRIINKIEVDGCLITDNRTPRCDYMFEIDNPTSNVIYLELKGSDIDKAISQLYATMDKFNSRHKSSKKECHIIASRVTKASPKTQTLRTEMLRKKKVILTISTNTKQIII